MSVTKTHAAHHRGPRESLWGRSVVVQVLRYALNEDSKCVSLYQKTYNTKSFQEALNLKAFFDLEGEYDEVRVRAASELTLCRRLSNGIDKRKYLR